jgi:hypothetical protein
MPTGKNAVNLSKLDERNLITENTYSEVRVNIFNFWNHVPWVALPVSKAEWGFHLLGDKGLILQM